MWNDLKISFWKKNVVLHEIYSENQKWQNNRPFTVTYIDCKFPILILLWVFSLPWWPQSTFFTSMFGNIYKYGILYIHPGLMREGVHLVHRSRSGKPRRGVWISEGLESRKGPLASLSWSRWTINLNSSTCTADHAEQLISTHPRVQLITLNN